MISVVVRAKNEARWIGRCLTALRHQLGEALDIILVDNDSTDETVAIAQPFNVKVVTISREDFTFGRALNVGIQEACFETVSLLSAHCIPVNDLWAQYMNAHLANPGNEKVCGVYGCQEPLPDTSHMDRRDLWTTFRSERKSQRKDFFFHNANASIRKSVWEKEPFNEEIQGVEDREWGRRMIEAGYKIVYEPEASDYHHHGIHQGRNEERARRVAEVIEYIQGRG